MKDRLTKLMASNLDAQVDYTNAYLLLMDAHKHGREVEYVGAHVNVLRGAAEECSFRVKALAAAVNQIEKNERQKI